VFLLAPLVSIATEFVARYATRLLVAGVLVLAVLASVQAVRSLRQDRDRAQIAVATTTLELRRVEGDLELERRSAAEAADALDQAHHQTASAWLQVERLKARLANAQQAVPAGCEHVLDPLRDAFRGLHDIRGAAGATGSPPAASRAAGVHR
jgi:negative regulator of sigma E activity